MPSVAPAADVTHLFDATLSLTGDCSVASIDPVADPGCPGGAHPSSGAFRIPQAVAVDRYGNRYVGSFGPVGTHGSYGLEGRIDIFDADGRFITEVDQNGPVAIAVDSAGTLYVKAADGTFDLSLLRYEPTTYNPQQGEIAYGDPPTVIADENVGRGTVAVNPADDHLFDLEGGRTDSFVREYSSAADGNVLVAGSIGVDVIGNSPDSIALDPTRGRLYVSGYQPGSSPAKPTILEFELGNGYGFHGEIDGSSTPVGSFPAEELSVAAEESTGRVFVGELAAAKRRVHVFEANGSYVSTIERNFAAIQDAQLVVDNGPQSPNHGYLYVPSSESSPGRSLAFAPSLAPAAAEVESVGVEAVTEHEAVLAATVNTNGGPGSYRFEYMTEQKFEEGGGSFDGAEVAAEGSLPAAKEGTHVSATARGLLAGTAYRFRVIAKNEGGEGEAQGGFTTYATPEPPLGCPNEALRTALSAALPDCRAYELVTPSDTGGHPALGHGRQTGYWFPMSQASPSGDTLSFMVDGGTIPGLGGTGGLFGDPYLSRRGPAGWNTATAGPDGVEAPRPIPGSVSPDLGYSFWGTNAGLGAAAVEGKNASYIRYPDGHSELLGRGSIGTDLNPEGRLIAPYGEHVVFSRPAQDAGQAVRLEPAAPPNGTAAIYDRTADKAIHVVSLLPGDVTPAAGQHAAYAGASFDGEGVAFTIAGTLYLRYANQETHPIGSGVTFAGVADGGDRAFYVEGGNLKAFDVEDGVIPFTTSGDATVVNVSRGGDAAYFVSPSVLAVDANPIGAMPQPGKENLYLSEEGAISFVGTVNAADVEGVQGGVLLAGGLGQWTEAINGAGGIPKPTDPSRTTPDGRVLLFESSADLTGYDSDGYRQVYRYDSVEGTLACLSCDPTGLPPTGDATLQSIAQGSVDDPPLSEFGFVQNLRGDGRRAFFQSPEALVLADTDGLQDVYEWQAEGVGSCRISAGCVDLISSGTSGRDDYLFAVSESGDDVFFRSADLLLPAADPDETPSVYDARVGGGFATPQRPTECLGEVCQPSVSPPADPPQVLEGSGNVAVRKRTSPRRCPKGKRMVRLAKKHRCVPRKRRHKQSHTHRRAK